MKRTSRRTVLLKGGDMKRTSRRTVLLKGGDMKRTSRRTVLLNEEDLEENQLLKGGDMKRTSRGNRAANRQKYEDNSAAIKASKRSRYWNDPDVRLAKCASERTRYPRGHRTTTTTQWYVMACCINIKKLCMQHL